MRKLPLGVMVAFAGVLRLRHIGGVLVLLAGIMSVPVYGLEAATAGQAYKAVEGWVAANQTPVLGVAAQAPGGPAGAPAAQVPGGIEAADVFGVQVVLRMGPIRMGTGQAHRLPEDPAKLLANAKAEKADITPLLIEATAAALKEARGEHSRLQERQPAEAPITPFSKSAKDLRVDLQLIYNPQRRIAVDTAGLARMVTWGQSSLAVYHNGRWALGFGPSAVATNLTPPSQINTLMLAVGLDATQAEKLGRADGPAVVVCETYQLVKFAGAKEATVMRRGVVPMEPTAPTGAQVDALCDQWAKHLMERQQDDGTFLGKYSPTSNNYSKQTAAHDAAMTCLALLRYAATGTEGETTRQARDAARRGLIALLAGSLADGQKGYKVDEVAVTLLALSQAGAVELRPQRQRLHDVLMKMRTKSALFSSGTGEMEKATAGLPSQCMAAWALVERFEETRDPADLRIARQTLDAIWAWVDAQPTVIDPMPWLPCAELRLNELGRGDAKGLMAAGTLLRRAWERQVGLKGFLISEKAGVESRPVEAVGGFDFGDVAVREPTWQSTRAAVGLARAMSGPAELFAQPKGPLMGREALGAGVSLAMGYLERLTLRQNDCAYYAINSKAAVGGVRMAVWDNQQPLYTTALALMAGAEVRGAVKVMEKKAEAAGIKKE